MTNKLLGNGFQLIRIPDLVEKHDPNGRWIEIIINDGRNRVGLISAPPGTPPDPHIHPANNEWWFVFGGTTQWQIGQYEPLKAEYGDVVVAPAGYSHDIRTTGDKYSLRVVVMDPNSNHNIRGIAPSRYIPVEYDLPNPNLIHTKFESIKKDFDENANDSQVVVKDNRNITTYVQTQNNHKESFEPQMFDHWIVVFEGEYTISDKNGNDMNIIQGDIVVIEANTAYSITTTSKSRSIRLVNTSP